MVFRTLIVSLTLAVCGLVLRAQAPTVFTDLGTLTDTQATYATPDLTNNSQTLAAGAIVWFRFTLAEDATNANARFLDFDTEGGTFDTEIGVYNNTGGMVANDDDDGSGLLSALSFGQTTPARGPIGTGVAGNGRDGGLVAGTYWLAYGAFNVTFGATNWGATSTGTATGACVINIRTNVTIPAVAPTITSTAPTTAFVGVAYSYTVTASGTPTPTFSIMGTLPAWLSFTSPTLSGTPGAGDVGTVGPLTITATNGVSPDATEVFSITVNVSFREIEVLDPNGDDVVNGTNGTVYAAVMATASTGTFDVNNLGNLTLNIASFTVGMLVNCTDASSGPGATIAGGGNDTFTIDITPTAVGAFSFRVTIVSDDADEGTFIINFSGVATAAAQNEIGVVNDLTGALVTDGGTVTRTNTGVSMYNHAFIVQNEGGAALTITASPALVNVTATANCTVVVNQPATGNLSAATTWLPWEQPWSLDITPTAAGAFSFTVTIVSDDADEGTFNFVYSGNTAAPSGGGGDGGGDEGGCSTDSSNYGWMMLVGLLATLAVALRVRSARE